MQLTLLIKNNAPSPFFHPKSKVIVHFEITFFEKNPKIVGSIEKFINLVSTNVQRSLEVYVASNKLRGCVENAFSLLFQYAFSPM